MFVPWTKSYDQPRQHIKKQRHYFANKGPYSESYGFSSGHAFIMERRRKKGTDRGLVTAVETGNLWHMKYVLGQEF